MSDNAFLPEQPAPDAASLEATLGAAHPWYLAVLEAAKGFETEWRHYGRKYGWKLKIHDGSKALLELTARASTFRMSLAVRENELEALQADAATAPLVAAYLADKARKEGWGLRLEVTDRASLDRALVLIKALTTLRKAD